MSSTKSVREWRKRNPQKYREMCIRYNHSNMKKKREFINKVKARPCRDCNNIYPPYVMDFDHIKGEKIINLGHATRYGFPKIIEEIKKCELVCSNCHRVRTHNRRIGLLI